MALDAEGYGYGSHEEGLERLLTDARVLSPAGIERAAWGWDRHEDPRLMQRFHDAERAGLRALEKSDRGPQWEEARRRILELTEGRTSLEDMICEQVVQLLAQPRVCGPSASRLSVPTSSPQ